MERTLHAQRGQTLPVWTLGILTTMMLMLMVFNYANDLRWQIRSQNAADAVAQAIMSVQTQHYNQMLMTLHAATVEEIRIRRTMQAMITIMQGNGGCYTGNHPTTGASFTFIDCATAYESERNNFVADVTRYGQLVSQIQSISQYTQAEQVADMETIANQFETSCNSTGTTGGDCNFKYTIATPSARPYLSGALIDAGGEDNGNGRALPAGLATDLQPLAIEVITCAKVSSPFPSFFQMTVAPYTAIGRAAATSAMVTQEWFAPGVQTNPNSASGVANFQQPEFPESSINAAPTFYVPGNTSGTFCDASSAVYDWYAVHWCSNTYTSIFSTPAPGSSQAPVYGGYQGYVKTDEFSVWTGWWSALPYPPYSGRFTPAANNCAQNVSWAN